MDSLQTLVDRIGVRAARNLVITQVTYPSTSSVAKEVPLVAFQTFNGKCFKKLIFGLATQQVCRSSEMQSTSSDISCILKLLSDCQELILLSKADRVSLYRGGFCILVALNELHPNTGNSISIDLNAVRNQFLKEFERDRKIFLEFSFFTLTMLTLLTISIGTSARQVIVYRG